MDSGLRLHSALHAALHERRQGDAAALSTSASPLANPASSSVANGDAPATAPAPEAVPARHNDPLSTTRVREPDQERGSEPANQPAKEPGLLSEEERRQVAELAQRDREVRAHEAAHAAAGGAIAGAPTYSFQRGPDGRLYAVGGEVGIDTSPIPGDPQATVDKARTIIQAATAPANPSSQDLRAAAQARAMLIDAEAELARTRGAEAQRRDDDDTGESGTTEPSSELEQQQLAAEERAERRDRLSDESADRLERSMDALHEFADALNDLNRRLERVQRQMIDSGAISPEQAIGNFLDTNA